MNKILRVGLFLALLAICYADTLAQEEEKGLFKRFIELFSLSSNPTYENGKYMPLEKHHAAFAEKSSETNPEGFLPTDGQVEESPVKDSVADVQKDQNWDKNSYIETSSTQATEEADKTQILKSAKAEKKRKIILAMVQKQNLKSEENQIELKPTIFKESKKSRLFKPENKNIVLTQTQTGTRDDPPPQQPQGGTIEDSKTAASIDALKTQIKDDVDKATDDMKDDMKKNNEELKAQLKAATDDLKDQIVQSQKNITTVVKNESRKVQDEIKKDTKMLKKEVDIVGLKVDDNLVQTIKLRIMALQDQLEQKQALLADITAQANELRSQLPPPKTICDTFFDCSTCAGNPKCGWCIAEQKCVEGDKIGPLHMSCNFYDYGICSGGGCSRYKDCDSCVGDPLCGFCADNNKCLERPADFNGCKPSNWFHSQGNQPLCPLPDVTSEDPLKDVQPKKIVDDGSKPKETPPPPQEPDEEKELIRKKQDQLIKLESKANQLKTEIDEIKKELNEARAERDKYEKILAANAAKMAEEEEEQPAEEEEEEKKEQEEEDDNSSDDDDDDASPKENQ